MNQCNFRKLIEEIIEKNNSSIEACESERDAIKAVLAVAKPVPESDPLSHAKNEQLKALKLYLDATEVAIAYLKDKAE